MACFTCMCCMANRSRRRCRLLPRCLLCCCPLRLRLLMLPPAPPARQGNAGEEHEEVGEGESYQLEMMRCLREINADNNTVGWCVCVGAGGWWAVDALLATSLVQLASICAMHHEGAAWAVPRPAESPTTPPPPLAQVPVHHQRLLPGGGDHRDICELHGVAGPLRVVSAARSA